MSANTPDLALPGLNEPEPAATGVAAGAAEGPTAAGGTPPAHGDASALRVPDAQARARAAVLQHRLASGAGKSTSLGGPFAAALAAGVAQGRKPAPGRASQGAGRRPPAGTPTKARAADVAQVPDAAAAKIAGAPWARPPQADYAASLAFLAGPHFAASPTPFDEEPALNTPEPPTRSTSARPPHDRPTVRGPVGRGRVSEAAAPASRLLEETADAALLLLTPEGVPSMQLSIRDELFGELQCTVGWGPEGVTATFYAADVNTRRLLGGEAERLRLRLAERGLKVAGVRVADVGEAPEVRGDLARLVGGGEG